MIEDEPPTAVLLIAHGSRNESANRELHDLAERMAAEGPQSTVVPCFLELAEPDIPAGGDRCVVLGARRVLMIPYFLSTGVHVGRDLVEGREALAERHPGVEFRLGAALGPDMLLDELVRRRVDELARDSR